VLPLSGFLVVHIAVNGQALRGDPAFERAVRAVQRLPGLAFVEWAFVLLPLAFHAAVGLWLVAARRPLSGRSYPRGLRGAVWATGALSIGFLAMHLPELRFRGGPADAGELATVLAADLSSTWHGVPWRGAAYLVGAACVAFHFAAGLWAFFSAARRGATARERRWAGWGAGAAGVVTWLLLANIVVYHATGSRLLGGEAEAPQSGKCR
jgi:succinate dehydrogenase / fumarate reductase cytochrome b subunit